MSHDGERPKSSSSQSQDHLVFQSSSASQASQQNYLREHGPESPRVVVKNTFLHFYTNSSSGSRSSSRQRASSVPSRTSSELGHSDGEESKSSAMGRGRQGAPGNVNALQSESDRDDTIPGETSPPVVQDTAGSQSAPSSGMVQQPGPGDVDALPSLGSVDHASGTCRPCAFFVKVECRSGATCRRCHYPHEGEKAKRLRQSKRRRRRNREAAFQHSAANEADDGDDDDDDDGDDGRDASLAAAAYKKMSL